VITITVTQDKEFGSGGNRLIHFLEDFPDSPSQTFVTGLNTVKPSNGK
jgi:hypothetical protein